VASTPSISPWRVGQLTPTFTFTILDDDGNVPLGLPSSPAAYTLRILNKLTGVITNGANPFISINTATGQVQYQLVTADVPTSPSKCALWVEVAYGTNPLFTDTVDWTITA